jgi:Tol biopolymer transport system component
VSDGTQRVIASSTGGFNFPAVSPDGNRIAYATGQFGWDVVEVSIPSGVLQTLVSGDVSISPDWAPSGTHFLYSIVNSKNAGIYDGQGGSEGFFRRLGEAIGSEARWSPDGRRFLFYREFQGKGVLRIANASGGGWVELDSADHNGQLRGFSWSPDGQWISYMRSIGGKTELAKIHAAPGAVPEVLANAHARHWVGSSTRWSPAGEWIAYPSAGGIDLVSPDGTSTRHLSPRRFQAFGFSKDGSQVFGIFQNTTSNGAQWQLYTVNVRSAAERFLAPIDFPASVDEAGGFSMHPDGKRFLTSIARFPFHIWMLEGFEASQQRSWLFR